MSQPTATVVTQEGLLHRIANRIRQSLELQEILDAMVVEVRDYLRVDRVKVYQFNPDDSGVVIAESIEEKRLPSLQGLHFPADDIPPYARELFLKARQRSVVDVDRTMIGISPLENPTTSHSEDSPDIRYRPLDPCHEEYLTAMGVKSSIIVPIVLEELSTGKEPAASPGQLWGLLACHHSESRAVTEAELQFIQAVVDQVGVAIAQSILLNRVRAQAQQEANINRVTKLLQTSPAIKLQAALEEAVETLSGSGGRLYVMAEADITKEIYIYGLQPSVIDVEHNRTVEENYLWKNFVHSVTEANPDTTGYKPWSVQWMNATYKLGDKGLTPEENPDIWAINDIYREPLFRTLAPFFEPTSVRGLLIVPLYYGDQVVGSLSVFRDEIDTEITWAGWHNPDSRQLMARRSFEVWQQEKTGTSQAWTFAEISYAKALSERFSTAIKQYRLYQQVQSLNANLEQQVEERTEQLQQKTIQLQSSNAELESFISRQQALSGIVAKIRESLNIEDIFQITTAELSQLMKADKVSVYRFNEDWGGEFVSSFESVSPHWKEVGQFGENTVWNDTHLQETKGGRYRNGENFVVNDVTQQGFSQCHIDIYNQYEIKSFINVPIFFGQELWGILAVFQQQHIRQWKPSEVDFVSQISGQLGVALQHSTLLTRMQHQARELKASNTELFRAIDQQKTLSSIVAKIRESLDINQIFKTTTKELTQVLKADRASVYRFDKDWGGEFIAEFESVALEEINVGQLGINTVWDDTYLQENEGGRYRDGKISVVNNVYDCGFSQCHLDLYEQFQIKAFVLVPIFVEQKLWGLLGTYQHKQPRQWNASEVEFVEQIAAQLGVATQHASLAASDQQKNSQLSTALVELRATQTQLIQTEKMSSLGQLVAGIAHEINNPVNFIHANVAHLKEYSTNLLKVLEAYQQSYPDPSEEIQALLEDADIDYLCADLPKLCMSLSTGTQRIRSIITSLRNFSRLDEAEVKAVDLQEGIEGTLLILQHRLKTSRAKVSVEIAKDYGELPLVECHASQINQVFMNLITNAIDELQAITPATEEEENKTIHIKTQQIDSERVRISIQDDGRGISKNALDKLFDPFFTTKPVGKGTGLGLSISYQIIEKHGGKLYCESVVGEGTTFVIELPTKMEAA
ncbi:GAF domain-containing protein [cf. Phormidesmis sp. LEGE 11477]|uniref:GAF domain-containing protein n=1 Tax=cf. Phormidesmis sp. LEGE 11477 TaxID=1828680 RepID=UPI00188265FB|nr:GAF domain-containing protein [cf. Phormidesmis sp. LEGE 11477]MBE9060415.1 GAF domain-containing protein [cf. Phormidesmis sp. LEGE 11477]